MNESLNLELSSDRVILADTIVSDIDNWCEREYQDGHRKHLGASMIGDPCSRKLWYSFRWAKLENFGEGTKRSAGQILRLFQRGHREEVYLIEYLQGIGCVLDATPDTQVRVSDVGGHFGGSLDNIGLLPPRYGIFEKCLFEFKTSNDNYFNKLKKDGVKLSKPVHWSQMCVYGYKKEIRLAVYLCINKDTDEIYIEILRLDWDHAKSMIDKAGMVITSPTPLAKLSLRPTAFECKFCHFKEICHHGESMEINCRTCKWSKPVEGGLWVCNLAHGAVIPDEIIATGCQSYSEISPE